jgi:RNA polymerase sigma factor (TIGR02999 family)
MEIPSRPCDRLIPLVYAKLRQLAGAYFRNERVCHTLQPTALVNETYLRLARSPECVWKTHTQFIRLACCVMRQTLIDHARKRKAAIRGGNCQRVALNEESPGSRTRTSGPEETLDLKSALRRLESMDPRKSKVVELRYFAGLTVEETAEAMGISARTVKSDWNLAKAWLRGELHKGA